MLLGDDILAPFLSFFKPIPNCNYNDISRIFCVLKFVKITIIVTYSAATKANNCFDWRLLCNGWKNDRRMTRIKSMQRKWTVRFTTWTRRDKEIFSNYKDENLHYYHEKMPLQSIDWNWFIRIFFSACFFFIHSFIQLLFWYMNCWMSVISMSSSIWSLKKSTAHSRLTLTRDKVCMWCCNTCVVHTCQALKNVERCF